MCMTDEAMAKLADAMRESFGAGYEFELALGELVGKYRRAHDAAMRDQEAARLLPHIGADALAIRQGCHRVTTYRRAKRAIVARFLPVATSNWND